MRVLVTGASGFVGHALLRRLKQAGHEVRAAVREGGKDASIEYAPVGDMRAADWDAVVRDVDVVIHLAARVHVMSDNESDPIAAYRVANVDVSERLAAAAARAGVRRLIFVSSIKAMVEHVSKKIVDISDPARPASPYGISKLEAERALARIAAETGIELVIFRPPLMYGPGVKGNFRSLVRACERGLPLPFSGIKNRRSILFVGNFADALVRSIDQQSVVGQTFLIHDDVVSVSELVLEIADALGTRPRLFRLPRPILKALEKLPQTAPAVERLTGSLYVDDRQFREATKWVPPVSRKEALAITVRHDRVPAGEE